MLIWRLIFHFKNCFGVLLFFVWFIQRRDSGKRNKLESEKSSNKQQRRQNTALSVCVVLIQRDVFENSET